MVPTGSSVPRAVSTPAHTRMRIRARLTKKPGKAATAPPGGMVRETSFRARLRPS